MRRAIGYGLRRLSPRRLLILTGWAVVQAAPTAVGGAMLGRAVDNGFLAGRPGVGLGLLGVVLVAAAFGALGARQLYRRLGDLVEPLRDDLVHRVVAGALHGVQDDREGAVSRLTRQTESVRDSFAGLLVVLVGFTATVIGVTLGLLSLQPILVALIVGPFLLGCAMFVCLLGTAAARYRAAIAADEHVVATAGAVLAGIRDVAAAGAERPARGLVAGPIDRQAAAERALAGMAALRTVCFAVGGWLPLLMMLAAGPRLVAGGLTAGELLGGLMYVLVGLQPALRILLGGLGDTALRFAVTTERILAAGYPPEPGPGPTMPAATSPLPTRAASQRYDLESVDVGFRYGPMADPVLSGLNLLVPEGDHLAIVGASGIGKSTLAALLCGLLQPDTGWLALGGVRLTDISPDMLPGRRVLIPQEAYVFTGSVRANLTYLLNDADDDRLWMSAVEVGSDALIGRLGGLDAPLRPDVLSAGERQLIALTRAHVSPAPIMVLDEATCHLDPDAERRAEEAFAARPGTLIVIAHRLTSVRRARTVLFLDGDGAVHGTRADLLTRSAGFAELDMDRAIWDRRDGVEVR